MNKKNTLIFASLFLSLFLFAFPQGIFASTGVRIDTGKIVLEKPITAGASYALPNIQVTNSGTDPSEYGVSVEYNEKQEQSKPDVSWFHFDPVSFRLMPGETKLVKTTLTIAPDAHPGNYFAYVEAHTQTEGVKVKQSISGAAATKLYFSIAQTNGLKTAYYVLLTFVASHSPWTKIAVWVIGILLAYWIVKRVHFFVKK